MTPRDAVRSPRHNEVELRWRTGGGRGALLAACQDNHVSGLSGDGGSGNAGGPAVEDAPVFGQRQGKLPNLLAAAKESWQRRFCLGCNIFATARLGVSERSPGIAGATVQVGRPPLRRCMSLRNAEG